MRAAAAKSTVKPTGELGQGNLGSDTGAQHRRDALAFSQTGCLEDPAATVIDVRPPIQPLFRRGITEIRAAAAEEALGCLSPTGCGRNDQARHESEQGHLPNVSYRRETMCLRGLLLEALSLCVAVLSIGAGTGALPGPDAR